MSDFGPAVREGAISADQGAAQEIGGCNCCSYRSGDVLEITLGPGRLSFRLCAVCAADLLSMLSRLDLSALRHTS